MKKLFLLPLVSFLLVCLLAIAGLVIAVSGWQKTESDYKKSGSKDSSSMTTGWKVVGKNQPHKKVKKHPLGQVCPAHYCLEKGYLIDYCSNYWDKDCSSHDHYDYRTYNYYYYGDDKDKNDYGGGSTKKLEDNFMALSIISGTILLLNAVGLTILVIAYCKACRSCSPNKNKEDV